VFGSVGQDQEPVGEIWFSHPRFMDAELMVKYLFTSERLSIQVHPGNEAARRGGHPRGKDEAWLILSADPGAQIGIGTTHPVTGDVLRAAALDGSIESLITWHPAKAGDVFYSPRERSTRSEPA
jgi:mannose-6-phosphate isomerase